MHIICKYIRQCTSICVTTNTYVILSTLPKYVYYNTAQLKLDTRTRVSETRLILKFARDLVGSARMCLG